MAKISRFDLKCPCCDGKNSPAEGGTIKCLHCGTCGYIECADWDPFTDPDRELPTKIQQKMYDTSI